MHPTSEITEIAYLAHSSRWRESCHESGMTRIARINLNTLWVAILASSLLFSTRTLAQISNKQTAILVEANATPTCAGLDCPPWHVPPDFDVCLRVDQKFYFGWYRAPTGPWAKQVDLHKFEGESVEIQVIDKYISVVSPHFRARLKRIDGVGSRYRTEACKNPYSS
jgi:hypothetical protein